MRILINCVLVVMAVLGTTTGAEELVYTMMGETVTLRFPAGQDLDKYYIDWFFGHENGDKLARRNYIGGLSVKRDRPWNDSLSLSDDHSLVIKNVQAEFFGTFICQLNKNSIITYEVIKLDVTSPASPVLLGEPLPLACDTQPPSRHKKPQTHWLNPQGARVENNRGSLPVKATGRDNGQWTCVVVTNDNKEHRAKISVTVVDLSPVQNPQYTSVSSPLTVPCSIPKLISWEQIKAKGLTGVHWTFSPMRGSDLISGGPRELFSLTPDDPVTWKAHEGTGLTPVPEPKKGNLSLNKNRAAEDDRGEYTCALRFNNGLTLNSTVHVEVLQITSSPGSELISGQQVNLSCGLGSRAPLPSGLALTWLRPDRPSSSSPPVPGASSSHVSIPAVGTADGGKWRCELRRGDTRLASADITLKIEPRLSVWMLVIICSVAAIVLLLILVFVLHRRRKMRHLRHRRFCRCKNPKPKGFYTTS